MIRMFTKVTSIALFAIILLSAINLYSQETKIRIIKRDAVLRLKPNNESIIIKKLPLGAVLNVEETIREWIKIKLPPDKDGVVVSGYMHKSFVEFEIKPSQVKPETKPIITEPKKEKEWPWEEKKEKEREVSPKPEEKESSVDVTFNIGGGFSNLTGDNGEYWKPGFYLSGSLFFPVSSIVSLGGYVTYHRWQPDEEEIIEPFSGYGIDIDITGAATFIEIAPSVRFKFSTAESFEFFIQTGGGISLMKLDIKAEAAYLWIHEEASISESDNRACLLFGGGIILGAKGRMRFELLTLYHIVFTEGGERTEYFSAGLGFGF